MMESMEIHWVWRGSRRNSEAGDACSRRKLGASEIGSRCEYSYRALRDILYRCRHTPERKIVAHTCTRITHIMQSHLYYKQASPHMCAFNPKHALFKAHLLRSFLLWWNLNCSTSRDTCVHRFRTSAPAVSSSSLSAVRSCVWYKNTYTLHTNVMQIDLYADIYDGTPRPQI